MSWTILVIAGLFDQMRDRGADGHDEIARARDAAAGARSLWRKASSVTGYRRRCNSAGVHPNRLAQSHGRAPVAGGVAQGFDVDDDARLEHAGPTVATIFVFILADQIF